MDVGGRSALDKVGPNDAGHNHELGRGQLDSGKEPNAAKVRGVLMVGSYGSGPTLSSEAPSLRG
jgi:hypothetical protein